MSEASTADKIDSVRAAIGCRKGVAFFLRALGGALALASTLCLLAFGGGSAAFAGPSQAHSTVTITVWHNHPEWKDTYQAMINAFQKANPGIKVKLTMIPAPDYSAKIQSAIASGTLPDMFHVFPALVPQLKKQRKIVDLTGHVNMSRVIPSAKAVAFYNGRLLAVPWNGFSAPPMYSVDIFTKYNLAPPTSWNNWLAEMATLKNAGVTPMEVDGKDNTQLAFLYMGLVGSIIGRQDSFALLAKGTIHLNDPNLLPALQFIVNMKPYFEDGYLAQSYTAAKADFASGRAAMIAAGGHGDQAGFVQVNPNLNDSAFGVPAPQASGKSVSVVGNDLPLVVSSASKHRDAAIRFAKFLVSKKAQFFVANYLGKTVRSDVISNKNKVFNALNHAGTLQLQGWWEMPALADVFSTYFAEGSGLLTGRYSVQQFADLLQSKVKVGAK